MIARREPTGWRRHLGMLGGVALSAALYTAAYPPIDVHATALIALTPLFFVLDRCTRVEALGFSLTWSLLAMSVGVTDWLVPAVSRYYEQPIFVGVGLLVGTTLVGASLEYAAVGLWYQRVRRRVSSAVLVVATAAAWAAAELCRTRIGFGNPWGLFGYAIVDGHDAGSPWHALAQVGDLGGVYAVTFVLVACNVALSQTLRLAAERRLAAALRPLLVGVAVFTCALGYGSARLRSIDGPDAAAVRVAAVQPNLDLGSQWREELYGRNLDEHLDLTARVARAERASIVFWPENAMTFFVDREPAYRAVIGRVLTAYDLELVAGAPRFEDESDARYFNSAFVLAPDGEITARYDKRRLLPFGEYFPLGAIELLRRNFGRVREITSGSHAELPDSRLGTLGLVICNEAMFPEEARARCRDGATVLVNLSNDAWLNDEEFAETQLRIAIMRAIEQRRYLVRSSTTGPSAIIDPAGRVLARGPLFEPAIVSGDVAPLSELSTYARFGDAFAWACLTAALVVAGAAMGFKDESGR